MDIIPNKKSNLLYQKGDRKIKGVVDLRRFAETKKERRIKTTNKIVSEIIRKEERENRRLHSPDRTVEPKYEGI